MGRELSLAVASLRAAYPNANLPPETVAVYSAALADLEPERVSRAVGVLIKRSRFFPTVAEIRDIVADQTLDFPSPVAAWEEAVARTDGTWEREKHPVVSRALAAIGGPWTVRTTENVVGTRAQFLKFYEQLCSEARTTVIDSGEDGIAEVRALGVPVPELRGLEAAS